MKNYVTCFLAFIVSATGIANDGQNNPLKEIENLRKEVLKNGLSTEDINEVTKIRVLFERLNLDSAYYYSNIELRLAQQTENPNIIANTRLAKATILSKLQQSDIAYDLLEENLNARRLINDTILAQSLFRIAKVEIQKQLPIESFQHAVAASELYIEQRDSVRASQCYSHMAGVYVFILDEPEKSIPYFDKALTFSDKKDVVNNIRIYINYSGAYVGMTEFGKAIEQVRNAEMIAKKSNVDVMNAGIYAQYAMIYNTAEEYELSLDYALKADSIIQSQPRPDMRTGDKITWHLALNYKALGKFDKAIYYFKLLENTPLLDSWAIQEQLSEIYDEQGDYNKSNQLLKEIISRKDSAFDSSRSQQLKEVTEKYENEIFKQEIQTLNAETKLKENQIRQQSVILYGTIAFFALLTGFTFFWYRTRMKLKETTQNLQSAELQQRFLRTQLNPHFFFHALTSIESYIYNNDKNEAAAFLRDFSRLMRNILEFSDVDLITLEQDVNFIKKYIELQRLSHDFKFEAEVTVDPALELNDIYVPPMLIQPAVENAILHGALVIENGHIGVDYALIDSIVKITISDNGKTRSKGAKTSSRLNRSMSTDITMNRIETIRKITGFQIFYTSNFEATDGASSSVEFAIPLNFQP